MAADRLKRFGTFALFAAAVTSLTYRPTWMAREWHVGTFAPDFETQGGLDERFASALAHIADNDTPIIDERATTRGRSARKMARGTPV